MKLYNRNGILYIYINGIRKSSGLKDTKENRKLLENHHKRDEFYEKFNVQTKSKTVIDFCEEVLREKEKTLEPTSIHNYYNQLEKNILPKFGKKYQDALKLIEADKFYAPKEAVELVKKTSVTKFDSTVEVAFKLGVNPKYADQQVRGALVLPHGTGKSKSVLVFAKGAKVQEAEAAGADYVGLDDYIAKIKGGWTDIDVIITMPSIMGKIGALGRVLGPRGLMPNPKSGTVTNEVGNAVKEVKQGKIDFKVDKTGIVHTSVGKVSFNADQIRDNAKEFISTLMKLKPSAAKGTYVKSIYLSSTMSAGIKIDPKSVEEN